MKPGVYPSHPFSEYLKIDAINQSRLKPYGISPMQARYEELHPEDDTTSTLVGHASHAAILEPEVFTRDYTTAPKCDRRTIEGKATWKAHVAANGHKISLDPDEMERALAIAKAVHLHPISKQLLSGPGRNELTAVWERGGLLCKGRIDRLAKWNAWPSVIDIKTTKDHLTQRNLERVIMQYGYHEQAAFYLDGLNRLAPTDRRYIIIFVNNEPPHDVAVKELSEYAIEIGGRNIEGYLQQHHDCLKKNNWPGISSEIEVIDLPAWAK